ncbi:MAG: synthase subunit [Desulfacinum sp.]|jgi:F-type H+-transporting ATPase subunit b|nr:synthase subunit [Desulfacinum sp.]
MRRCRATGLFVLVSGVLAATAVLAAEGGGHGGGLPWKDFFLRLMNFAIMLAILVKLLKKPVTNFFASRRENIQRLLTELEQQKKEAESKAAEYKAKLAALDKETEKILAEYIQEGEAEKRKIVEAAEKQAAYIKEQAKLAIQQEIKAAKESLQEEIAELSVNAAEDLLKKNIRPEDQDRLVDEFMTKAVEAK